MKFSSEQNGLLLLNVNSRFVDANDGEDVGDRDLSFLESIRCSSARLRRSSFERENKKRNSTADKKALHLVIVKPKPRFADAEDVEDVGDRALTLTEAPLCGRQRRWRSGFKLPRLLQMLFRSFTALFILAQNLWLVEGVER